MPAHWTAVSATNSWFIHQWVVTHWLLSSDCTTCIAEIVHSESASKCPYEALQATAKFQPSDSKSEFVRSKSRVRVYVCVMFFHRSKSPRVFVLLLFFIFFLLQETNREYFFGELGSTYKRKQDWSLKPMTSRTWTSWMKMGNSLMDRERRCGELQKRDNKP